MLHPRLALGEFAFGRFGHAALAAIEFPGLDEGADGCIERAARFLPELLTQVQEVEQVLVDAHRLPRGTGVEPANLAVLAVDGQLIFESVDEVEGRFRRQHGTAEGKEDFEGGGHGVPASGEQGGGGRRSGGRKLTEQVEEIAACMAGISEPRPSRSGGTEPPFRRVAIAGIGLIGGSLALAIRDRWPRCTWRASTRAVLTHARSSGAIDEGLASMADLGEADLVVLAAPVRQNARLLTEVPARVLETAVLTDVGGTKRDIVGAARRLPPGARFVGGHPIGGAERGGFGFARRDLFRHRPWILTPLPGSDQGAVRALRAFIEAIGARPVIMDPRNTTG